MYEEKFVIGIYRKIKGGKAMLPDKKEAKMLLQEAGKMNPGTWESHSEVVADCARKIADNCTDMNPYKAYVLGLLHDIGRRFGVMHLAMLLMDITF